ncbi:MAG: four helix bundle protein [Proteobacteria bacterium]|nr:four helix bundle protein [Pseudomonadota bacterium]
MGFKFEKLEIWQLSLECIDLIYHVSGKLPSFEDSNLRSQINRAATSISLNIAEGSTSQTDREQKRFIGMAIRSLVECVACLHVILKRKYIAIEEFNGIYAFSEKFFAKLQAFRRSLT